MIAGNKDSQFCGIPNLCRLPGAGIANPCPLNYMSGTTGAWIKRILGYLIF